MSLGPRLVFFVHALSAALFCFSTIFIFKKSCAFEHGVKSSYLQLRVVLDRGLCGVCMYVLMKGLARALPWRLTKCQGEQPLYY